jgi:hypothetical protein
MGNQTQNPGQNPTQKAPGQDDKSRRDTNPQNPNDPNRQRTPGSNDDNQKRNMQDKQGNK